MLRPGFAEFGVRFASVAELGPGPVAQPAVAGRVDEHRRAKPADDARGHLAGLDAGDPIAGLLQADGHVKGEQADAGGRHGRFAFLLRLDGVGMSVRVVGRVDRFQNRRAFAGNADRVDADLLAGVAAEDRTVLDQRHLEPLRPGGQAPRRSRQFRRPR